MQMGWPCFMDSSKLGYVCAYQQDHKKTIAKESIQKDIDKGHRLASGLHNNPCQLDMQQDLGHDDHLLGRR